MTSVPILSAVRAVFKGRRPFIEATLVSFVIFALFILVPVWTTPGNDIAFQLHLLKPSVYVLITTLSLLNGLLIEMQIYLHRHRCAEPEATEAVGALGIIASSLLATVSCASCYSSLLALLGLGGATFVVTYRWWFATLAIALTLIALSFVSRRVMGLCGTCKIKQKPAFRLW